MQSDILYLMEIYYQCCVLFCFLIYVSRFQTVQYIPLCYFFILRVSFCIFNTYAQAKNKHHPHTQSSFIFIVFMCLISLYYSLYCCTRKEACCFRTKGFIFCRYHHCCCEHSDKTVLLLQMETCYVMRNRCREQQHIVNARKIFIFWYSSFFVITSLYSHLSLPHCLAGELL